MVVFTHTMTEITVAVEPNRFFQALAIDSHNLLPKIMPYFIQSMDIQGDPTSAGCIRQLHLPEGGPYGTSLKNRVDEIDVTKCYIKYTTFEGDVLGDTLEYVVYETTYEPSGDGTHLKCVAHYHTKGDQTESEAAIVGAKETFTKMFKTVEEYLIANPQAYASA